MYKILKNTIEMDDYSIQRLSRRVSQYLWYKLWGNTKQGLLPDEYTQVEYIESHGEEYIDLNLPASVNYRYIIDAKLNDNLTSANYALFGGYSTNTSSDTSSKHYHQLCTNKDTNGWIVQFGTGWTGYGTKDNLRHVHDINLITQKYTIDNTTYDITSGLSAVEVYNITLFAVNSNPMTRISSITLYSFKIYENNILIRNLIPCYRNSDDEVGLYDLVNNQFYTNSGTGSFTYGSVAPTPSNPIEVNGVGERTENLFDVSTAEDTEYFINNSGILVNGANGDRFIAKKVMVAPLTEYTFSWGDTIVGTEGNSPYIRVSEYANTQFLSRVAYKCIDYVNKTFTLETGPNTNFLDIRYDSSTSLRQQTITNLMINSGSTALSYEPYGYKIPINCDSEIKNIYLNEPLHKINDYADILSYQDHNVVRKIKKLVLDGTENWYKSNASGGSRAYFATATGTSVENAVLCTHFETKPIYTTNDNIGITIISQGGIRIRTSDIVSRSVTDFKSFLSEQYANGTPVTIWYVLANEETEQIKAPDILANKYTSITVDTEVQPSQVDFSTKGKKVPQPSAETVRMLNSVNKANQVNAINSEELMTSEAEPDNLIEETKAELEEPIEKEQTKEVEPIEKEEIEVEPIEKTEEKEITKK